MGIVIACLTLACAGYAPSRTLTQINDRVRAIDATVTKELDPVIDKSIGQAPEGGVSCRTGGCPSIGSYYTHDIPYDAQQCRTWADELHDLRWGHGSPDGCVDERPINPDRGQPDSPACQVDTNHAALGQRVVITARYVDADTSRISVTSYWGI